MLSNNSIAIKGNLRRLEPCTTATRIELLVGVELMWAAEASTRNWRGAEAFKPLTLHFSASAKAELTSSLDHTGRQMQGEC
jgi:hypothetical protein